ncbi:MAG: hypothetical protein Q9187_005398 [Circinaria calcarea]
MAGDGTAPARNTSLYADRSGQPPTKPFREKFPFLIHSQDTLTNGLPPEADSRDVARPRRRRTSPEDHAILEAEYQRNSKPDKIARMDIVNRVALGEKEVQNRRQMTRRKARPLLPHEILSSLRSSQESVESLQSSSPMLEGSSQPDSSSSPIAEGCNGQQKPCSTNTKGRHAQDEALSKSVQGHPKNCVELLDSTCQTHNSTAMQVAVQQNQGREKHGALELLIPGSKPVTTSHLQPALVVAPLTAASTSRPLKRASSTVRLSMSLDGKAQVILENGSSPSPPRLNQLVFSSGPQRHGTLQRSQSEIGLASQSFNILNDSTVPWSRQLAPGRSRDARAWEFYCDSDARNALTLQAEEEQKGSAEGAIGLIRSSSSKVLDLSNGKRNVEMVTGKDPVKRKKTVGQTSHKPKLARTASSVSRLQTVSTNVQTHVPRSKAKGMKPGSQTSVYRDLSGDSDKENWLPGTRTSNVRRQRPADSTASTRRAVLNENSSIPSHSTSLGALLNHENATPGRHRSESKDVDREENKGNEVDEEVAAFTGESSVPREGEDLDCVQNLLSLSQGAWR